MHFHPDLPNSCLISALGLVAPELLQEGGKSREWLQGQHKMCISAALVELSLQLPGGSHIFLMNLVLILQDFAVEVALEAFFWKAGRRNILLEHLNLAPGKQQAAKPGCRRWVCTSSSITGLPGASQLCLADKLGTQISLGAKGKRIRILSNRFSLSSAGKRILKLLPEGK